MSRIYIDYLRDMLKNANRATQFTEGMNFETFSKDDKTVYAVIRAVEIIGGSHAQYSRGNSYKVS